MLGEIKYNNGQMMAPSLMDLMLRIPGRYGRIFGAKAGNASLKLRD
jgi:hypothetical protein